MTAPPGALGGGRPGAGAVPPAGGSCQPPSQRPGGPWGPPVQDLTGSPAGVWPGAVAGTSLTKAGLLRPGRGQLRGLCWPLRPGSGELTARPAPAPAQTSGGGASAGIQGGRRGAGSRDQGPGPPRPGASCRKRTAELPGVRQRRASAISRAWKMRPSRATGVGVLLTLSPAQSSWETRGLGKVLGDSALCPGTHASCHHSLFTLPPPRPPPRHVHGTRRPPRWAPPRTAPRDRAGDAGARAPGAGAAPALPAQRRAREARDWCSSAAARPEEVALQSGFARPSSLTAAWPWPRNRRGSRADVPGEERPAAAAPSPPRA